MYKRVDHYNHAREATSQLRMPVKQAGVYVMPDGLFYVIARIDSEGNHVWAGDLGDSDVVVYYFDYHINMSPFTSPLPIIRDERK